MSHLSESLSAENVLFAGYIGESLAVIRFLCEKGVLLQVFYPDNDLSCPLQLACKIPLLKVCPSFASFYPVHEMEALC